MKAKLVGTRLGVALLSFERWKTLKFIPVKNPESACAVANGILADKLISQLCPAGGTFLDIGAHIGSIFSSVHYFDSSVTIIAFEADPQKNKSLKKKFPYCQLFEVAVGESDGIVDFYLNPGAPGYNSLLPQEEIEARKISVRIAAIDDLLFEATVDVIKIDIEGAELGALRGGEDLVRRSRPTVMFESVKIEPNSLGYSAQLLWEWFDALDFEIFTPDRVPHNAEPLNLTSFIDGHQYPFRTHNYFAIPREKRIAVRDRAREIIGIIA